MLVLLKTILMKIVNRQWGSRQGPEKIHARIFSKAYWIPGNTEQMKLRTLNRGSKMAHYPCMTV